jgi:hypothetical protein
MGHVLLKRGCVRGALRMPWKRLDRDNGARTAEDVAKITRTGMSDEVKLNRQRRKQRR